VRDRAAFRENRRAGSRRRGGSGSVAPQMRARMLVLLVAAGLVAGGTALAQGGGQDPYSQPEPVVRDGQVLRLASASACLRDPRLRVRFTPPAGAIFGWFEVSVRGRQVARLTGIPRAASATVRLPQGRSTVRVEGETLGGQLVDSLRVYRTCEPPPAPPPIDDRPIQQGGGED
jgi:hypothetical protein